MLAKFLLGVLIWASPASAQLVVTDPAQTTVAKLQLEVTQLHATFMKMQMVQDAITLKNNYLAAQQYYDTIYAHSQHRGGLMGYYKDYFNQQFDNIAADQWRQINTEASTITGTTEVGRLLNAGSAAISNTAGQGINAAGGYVGSGMNNIDGGYKGARAMIYTQKQQQIAAVDKMIDSSEARADATKTMIQDLVSRGSKDMINDSERESIDMHAALLQLQVLSDMRQLLNLTAQISNAQAKQNLLENAISLQTAKDLATYRSGGGARQNSSAASSDQLVHELKRSPNQP